LTIKNAYYCVYYMYVCMFKSAFTYVCKHIFFIFITFSPSSILVIKIISRFDILVYLQIYIYVYVCIYMYIDIFIYMYIYMYSYIYTYIFIYVFLCIYLY
jgi:hypothetical protein